MTRVLTLALACSCGAAAAQGGPLADPTRPPSAVAERPASEAAAPAGPRLQSVLISPTRRVAVISGKTVAQGGKFGDATVASITESAVLLRYPDRKETLQLVPDVAKHPRRVTDAAISEKGKSR